MESRKITIISSATQSRKEIMTSAETLAELKQDLTNAGISYDDMVFMEGYTKTELKSDSSVLPTNVPTKKRDADGNVITTNELVFMLTAPQKKIKSGAMSYVEMKSYIKEHNLAEEFKKEFGKNYTQGSAEQFTSFLKKYLVKKETKSNAPLSENDVKMFCTKAFENEVLSEEKYVAIMAILDEVAPSISDAEISEMFDFV